MTLSAEFILESLSPFADLGTEAPVIVSSESGFVARLIREGLPMELAFHNDGSINERYGDRDRRHLTLRALLASASFANLGKWADSQTVRLKERVSRETLPIVGRLSDVDEQGNIEYFDSIISNEVAASCPRVSVILVNGPAGIGKTSLIRALAYRRANSYRQSQKPLLLHVESRGRVLQNLTDLMAFSLQTLRLSITYDQVPVLVKSGLIVLAIDGFDELGDPNGYDLAWAQVNDLITSARGCGGIILAGRETFISKERMERALTAVDPAKDRLAIYSLCSLSPLTAKTWLQSRGWSPQVFDLETVAPLFEEGSYALRPFFLSELAQEGFVSKIENGLIEDLFSFLIESMIERETSKFGRDIEAATTSSQRRALIVRLMEEVVRDQAENQSDAIPLDTIVWLSEIVASEIIPPNLVGIFKNRAGVIAFLIDDDRRGYRRFAHEQVANYFLSLVTIDAVGNGETPKYIRRNIIGLEFLENFCSVFRQISSDLSIRFFSEASRQLNSLGDGDRARRNLGALILSACSVAESSELLEIENVSLDDVYVAESICPIRLKSVTIGQLYAREADLRNLIFASDCFVATLIADNGTIPPLTLPLPGTITLPSHTLLERNEKAAWLIERISSVQPDKEIFENIDKILVGLELFNLLSRLARFKPYWLKDGEEKAARRILDDPHWGTLKDSMKKHDLLVERNRLPASGRPALFYHVKNRKELLEFRSPSQRVLAFFRDLLVENLRMRGETKD